MPSAITKVAVVVFAAQILVSTMPRVCSTAEVPVLTATQRNARGKEQRLRRFKPGVSQARRGQRRASVKPGGHTERVGRRKAQTSNQGMDGGV